MKIRGCIVVLAILFSASLEAEWQPIIEPYLGYSQASTLVTAYPDNQNVILGPAPTVAHFSFRGFDYGIRLGGQHKTLGLMLGAEYLAAMLRGSGVGEIASQDSITRALKMSGYGVFLGEHIPQTQLRLWVAYFFDLTFSDSGPYNTSGEESGNTGYKLGVGYLLNEYTTLSLEYLNAQISRSPVSNVYYDFTYGTEDMRVITISLGCALGSFLD